MQALKFLRWVGAAAGWISNSPGSFIFIVCLPADEQMGAKLIYGGIYQHHKTKEYLAGTDNGMATRTWQNAMDALINTKLGSSQQRWKTAAKDKAFAPLLLRVIIETPGELLLQVMKTGTVSTNVYHRRLHNFCADMSWLPWPLIPKRLWPAVQFKEKRAITLEEHQKIIAAEVNHERKALYQLCWQLGGSQGDIASLKGKDVDWSNGTVSFFRKKTGVPVIVHLGTEALSLFKDLPAEGPLFPYLATVRAGDRATEFGQRCRQLGIKGVTLHSYRYAWAERARIAGYPRRQTEEALGHNSKAVHIAYAKRAQVTVASLEDYEAETAKKILRVEFNGANSALPATRA